MGTEHFFSEEVEGDGDDAVFLGFDARELGGPFQLDFFFGEARVLEDIGEEFEACREVLAHDIDGNDERVIPSRLVDGTALVFQGFCDLFRRAGSGSFDEEFAHQGGDAAEVFGFFECAGAEGGGEGD